MYIYNVIKYKSTEVKFIIDVSIRTNIHVNLRMLTRKYSLIST